MFGINWNNKVCCPFCLEMVAISSKPPQCPNPECNEELDAGYVNSYASCPGFFVPLLGLPKVGKTVYLQVLMLTLRRISRFWLNSCCTAADNETSNYLKEAQRIYLDRNMPPITQVGRQEVYIMQLRNLRPWKDMTLIFKDLSGEHYNQLHFEPEVINIISRESLLFMMLSLPDVLRDDYTIDELIHNYIHTVMSIGGRSTRKTKHMVVILTQADDVTHIPANIKTYLYSDTLWDDLYRMARPSDSNTFIRNYLRNLQPISLAIRDWLHHELAPVTALANNSQIDLHFCITSPLGSMPKDSKLSQPLHPYRILDPLFWALHLDRKNTLKRQT